MINEGATDRAVRVVLGFAILALTLVGPRSLIGLVGGVPLVTGLLGYCPMYELAGIRTCPGPQQEEDDPT